MIIISLPSLSPSSLSLSFIDEAQMHHKSNADEILMRYKLSQARQYASFSLYRSVNATNNVIHFIGCDLQQQKDHEEGESLSVMLFTIIIAIIITIIIIIIIFITVFIIIINVSTIIIIFIIFFFFFLNVNNIIAIAVGLS